MFLLCKRLQYKLVGAIATHNKRLIQKFMDNGYSKFENYYRFGFVQLKKNTLIVGRETGQDTSIPFAKLLKGIIVYQQNLKLYHEGPAALRAFGITHINSPIHSLLHLLEISDYE